MRSPASSVRQNGSAQGIDVEGFVGAWGWGFLLRGPAPGIDVEGFVFPDGLEQCAESVDEAGHGPGLLPGRPRRPLRGHGRNGQDQAEPRQHDAVSKQTHTVSFPGGGAGGPELAGRPPSSRVWCPGSVGIARLERSRFLPEEWTP